MSGGRKRRASQANEAKRFILNLLRDGKPKPVPEIKEACEREGLQFYAVRRMKDRLSMMSQRYGMTGPWYWYDPWAGERDESEYE